MRSLAALVLIFSWNCWGMDSQEAALAKIVNVQRLLQGMSTNGAQPQCQVGSAQTCDFYNLCEALTPQRKQAYLYQDANGRRLVNFNLMYLQEQVAGCLSAQGKSESYHSFIEQDPFANPRLLIGSEGQKYSQAFEKEEKRARDIAKDVRARLVSFLKTKRNSQNDKAIENLIQRVEMVEVTSFRPQTDVDYLKAGCYLPNAKFDGSTNKITLCPQLLGMPDATLFSVIAHELGHTIDSCYSSQAVMNANGQEIVVSPKWAVGKEILAPIPPSKNPLASTIQCLQRPQSMGYKLTTNAEKREDLGNYIAGLEENEGLNRESPEILNLRNTLRDFEEGHEENLCPADDEDHPASYMQESMADWLSAQVIGLKLKEEHNPEKAKAMAFETQLLGLQADCPAFASDQKEYIVQQMKAAGCNTLSTEELFSLETSPDSKDHPGWSKRTNKIYLAEPQIQEALQCGPPKDTVTCE